MDYTENIFFISARDGSGSGVFLPDKKIIITSNEVIKNQPKAIIRHHQTGKQTVQTVFTDDLYGLAVLYFDGKIEGAKPVVFDKLIFPAKDSYTKILGINYFFSPVLKQAKIKQKQNIYGLDFYEFQEFLTPQTDGGLVFSDTNLILGISIRKETQHKQILIPNFFVQQIVNQIISNNYKPLLRCPVCRKIIVKDQIIDGVCPGCGVKIPEKLINGEKTVKNETVKKIEKILSELGKDPENAIISRNLWEIRQGSATIFIKYDEQTKFIASFSTICKVERNKSKILEFILKENAKFDEIYFALHNDRLFLVSNYIYEEDFSLDLGRKIFEDLALKADYYDDIIIRMQNEQ